MSSGRLRTCLLGFLVAEVAACGDAFRLDDADAGATGSSGASTSSASTSGPGSGGPGSASTGAGGSTGSSSTGSTGGSTGSFATGTGGVTGTGGTSIATTTGSGGVGGSSGVAGAGGSTGKGGSGGKTGSAGAAGSGAGGAAGKTGAGGSAGAGGRSGAGGSGGSGGAGGSLGKGGAGGSGVVDAGPDAAVCLGDVPKCSGGACARLSWNFESGTSEGAVPHSGPIAVRMFDGSFALALDVPQLNVAEQSFTLPLCTSGGVDLRTKTLSFRVYFDGSPPSMYDFYVQTAVPMPQTGAYLDQIGLGTGMWVTYSSPMSKSTFSSSATAVTFQLGSLGGAFTGTIWIDDVRIQ